MSSYTTHSSKPHESILPRPHRDVTQRYISYGPIQPMEYPRSMLERLFGIFG